MAFRLGFRLWLSLWALMAVTLHLCAASNTSAMRGAMRWNYLDALIDDLAAADGSNSSSSSSISLRFPRRNIPEANTYQYIKIPFSHDAFSITGFRPDPTHVAQTHHFSIFLCSGTPTADEFERVTTLPHGNGDRPQCGDEAMLVGFDNMNGAANPESFSFPAGFGRTVGRRYGYTHAMLEIHFNAPVDDDASGFVLQGIVDPSPSANHSQISSVILLPDYFELAPHRAAASTSATATVRTSFKPVVLHFHFHGRGTSVHFNVTSPDGTATYLAASYVRASDRTTDTVRLGGEIVVPAGAVMRVRCVYDTRGEDRAITAGFESTDEMCNVFIVGGLEEPCDARRDVCRIIAEGDVM